MGRHPGHAASQARSHLTTPARRLLVLSVIAGVIGVLSGGAAWVLLHLIRGMTNLFLLHRLSWGEASLAHLDAGPGLLIAAVGGALVVSLFALWAPSIRGHGIPETMEAVLTRQSRIRPRVALAKPLATAIAIGTGGPFGAEGPIIVTGGALGSLIGQVIPVSPAERKILLASGAAAGMAAVFAAPVASVLLALELLLFEFSTRAFVPLVIASSIAGSIHIALFGSGALFSVPRHDFAGPEKLPFFVLAGVLAGILALTIVRGLSLFERAFDRLPIPLFWHPVLGALAFASIGLFVPRVLGVGYDSISDVLSGRLVISTLLVLAVAKLLAWWVALASGTSGGTLAPILLISGSFGGVIGHLFHSLYGGVSPGAVAVVIMGATFAAATRATFTSIVFLFELTRDYRIVLPLMLASVTADLIAHSLSKDSLFTEKLTGKGLRVRHDYEVDVMRTTLVRDVMTKEVQTLTPDTTCEDAFARWASGGHSAYPIVEEGDRLVGIVARRDLLEEDEVDPRSPIGDLARRDVVTVGEGESLLQALQVMLDEDVDHVPVVEGPRLVGICTRTDILTARRRQLDLERRQPGLDPSSLRRSFATPR